MNQIQEKNWWHRNWKWFVPVGCLSLIILIGGFLAVIIYFIFGFVKSTDTYKEAVERAKTNPFVMEALGSPLKEGFFVTGNIKVSGSSGEADFSIPISGPKGKARIFAVAKKSAGEWTFSTLFVVVKESRQRIDLLFKDAGTSRSTNTDKTDCPVPGKLIHWQAAYCMWLSGTDDFLEASVQKCFDERNAADENTHSTDCEKKRFYRRKLCELLVKGDYFQGTVFDCMKFKETIPRTVKEGGV